MFIVSITNYFYSRLRTRDRHNDRWCIKDIEIVKKRPGIVLDISCRNPVKYQYINIKCITGRYLRAVPYRHYALQVKRSA